MTDEGFRIAPEALELFADTERKWEFVSPVSLQFISPLALKIFSGSVQEYAKPIFSQVAAQNAEALSALGLPSHSDMIAGFVKSLGISDATREAFARLSENLVLQTPPAFRDLDMTATWLQEALPQTPEQAEEAEQVTAEIAADPQQHHVVQRIMRDLRQVDLAGMTPYAVLVLLAVMLFAYGWEPVGKTNRPLYLVAVLALIAAMIGNPKERK